jgi:flagellar basal body L-ring protein FlgH
MMKIAAVLMAVLCCGGALAQAPAPKKQNTTAAKVPKAPPEPSAYCSAAAVALFQGSGDAELAAVQQGCRRGDIIAISTADQGSVFQIGRLCDFSKAIVNTGGQVLCALTGTRGIR